MSNLETIQWVQFSERRDAANHPDGYADVFNRPNRDIYAVLSSQHSDDGTHKLADFLIIEEGSYAGNSTDDRVYSLTASSLQISFLMIIARGTQYPVLKSADMTGDNSKELETNAFQSNAIQDITTAGQFTLGDDASVNATGTTYDYIAIGGE